MSFLQGIIDKVEGVAGNHQHQNPPHSSSSFGFNSQEQYGSPWSQQGQPPQNSYQNDYQQRGVPPPGSYPYQEGYGHSTHNYGGGPPPPPSFAYSQMPAYENRNEHNMERQQWGEENQRRSPRQFEEREGEHHHNRGYQAGYERERNHSPEERRHEHHSEQHGHGHGHHQEHERRRSHSRD